MIYLLDTNTCIGYLNCRDPILYEHFQNVSTEDVCICDVVKSELYYGAYTGSQVVGNLETLKYFLAELISLPFDSKSAQLCGKIRADLRKKGISLGAYDLQIAAIALSHDLILVTHNTKEFSLIDSLKLIDWQV
ncbi:PilT protein domain protein [[Leptolyngbya] sp. PCC 7376]|uniref:type II toxin-antitoxin system VapC family toxin n=1 Tax=[Leptolyngbya] sp. PCC 7376 TaxID=111781 RepID=UPI00029F3014|nr:type II toxin-antitoxin system VapC family toxin [[Leptolyngbya] sp. PCC 7376]AFY37936.1 PilT protein domain protein [[Leptolyngbya] sp. PCC 7376]